jgi:hypothetical protein
MAESRRLIDVTDTERARMKAILEEQLPGKEYAATRESCLRNLSVTKHARFHALIQERYPGNSEEQIRRRALAWEKLYEIRQVPVKENTSSKETGVENTSCEVTSSTDTISKNETKK